MSKTDNPLARLQFTNRVRKRAQYEAFEYALTPEGVQVRNGSHANPEDHEYLITVRDGLPTHCTCPADARFEGACKHRLLRDPEIVMGVLNELKTLWWIGYHLVWGVR